MSKGFVNIMILRVLLTKKRPTSFLTVLLTGRTLSSYFIGFSSSTSPHYDDDSLITIIDCDDIFSVTEYDSYERVNAARRYMQMMGSNLNMVSFIIFIIINIISISIIIVIIIRMSMQNMGTHFSEGADQQIA